MNKKSFIGCLVFFVLIASSYFVKAQDSVLTLLQAKERLLKKNFYLLAAYYEINQAEAQVIQARLWYNPTVSWNGEAYSKAQKEYFKTRNQYEAQVSQTISIAGKHTNTVKLS